MRGNLVCSLATRSAMILAASVVCLSMLPCSIAAPTSDLTDKVVQMIRFISLLDDSEDPARELRETLLDASEPCLREGLRQIDPTELARIAQFYADHKKCLPFAFKDDEEDDFEQCVGDISDAPDFEEVGKLTEHCVEMQANYIIEFIEKQHATLKARRR